MSKPKYLSRFTYNSAVNAGMNGLVLPGTVRAVKFTEANVYYDVVCNGQLYKDVPSRLVTARGEEVPVTDTKEEV